MDWNEKGEVIIEDECIDNSHITDLVKCTLYSYKNLNPKGYDQFQLALQKSNIPQSLVQKGKGLTIFGHQNDNSKHLPPPGIPINQSKSQEWVWHVI